MSSPLRLFSYLSALSLPKRYGGSIFTRAATFQLHGSLDGDRSQISRLMAALAVKFAQPLLALLDDAAFLSSVPGARPSRPRTGRARREEVSTSFST